MTLYRSVWWSVTGLVAALSCPVAFLASGPGPIVSFAVAAGVLTAVVAAAVSPADLTARQIAPNALRQMAIGAAAGTVIASLVSLLGSPGLLLSVLLAASSPIVVGRVYTWRLRRQLQTRVSQLADERQRAEPPTVAVATLSTAELVHAWRTSFVWLNRAQTTASINSIVAQRQQYLDELERRDPAGLQRWLESDARAASDPGKYLRGNGGGAEPDAAA